ncbi:hypothetical protein D3C71_1746220 [compost metagenome]
MRLHLQQPAQGTLELEAQTPTGIQVLQLHLGRDDQLDVAIVELVHHVDETTGDVVGGDAHLLHVAQQYGVEDLAQLDVVVLAARTVAQRAEIEPGHVIGHLACTDLAILDQQHLVVLHVAVLGQQAAETPV